MEGPWNITVYRPSLEKAYYINVSFPQKISIIGLKNLIQEKSGLSPSQMRVLYTDSKSPTEKELDESSELRGPLFLRDYPSIKNGVTLFILEASS